MLNPAVVWSNKEIKAEFTFRAACIVRVGAVAGQTHMQGAAEAFVVRLCSWVRQYTVSMVGLPTQWYNAAFDPVTRLLTHKARVFTCKRQRGFKERRSGSGKTSTICLPTHSAPTRFAFRTEEFSLWSSWKADTLGVKGSVAVSLTQQQVSCLQTHLHKHTNVKWNWPWKSTWLKLKMPQQSTKRWK